MPAHLRFAPASGLVKLTQPRVNFTNILQAAFTRTDPKSAKKDSQVTQLFVLLGSALVKAAHKHVGKFTQPRAFLFGYSPTPHTHELNKTDQKFGISYENVY